MAGLSFVTLLAYDYRYAFAAIRAYYAIADEIILGVDRERLSWSAQPFDFDLSAVAQFIEREDPQKKIRLYEGNYHASSNPMENDTLERRALSELCTPGNWIVQIDADEIVQNPAEFCAWLLATNPKDRAVGATWLTVFKRFGDEALVIDPPKERVPVATMLRSAYTWARQTPQQPILSPLVLFHLSWGRSEAEVRQKLTNWGHAKDFDVDRFLQLWQSVTLENYASVKNFHPLDPPLWESLKRQTLELRRHV